MSGSLFSYSRTTNTGQWACLITDSETPPISALRMAPSPLLPITIVPTSSSSLSRTISLSGLSRLEVRLGNFPTGRLDLLGLLLEQLTSLPFGLLEDRLHDLRRVDVMSPELRERREHVGHVYLRAGVLGELGGRLCGQAGLFGTVGGQEYLRRKYAHLFMPP